MRRGVGFRGRLANQVVDRRWDEPAAALLSAAVAALALAQVEPTQFTRALLRLDVVEIRVHLAGKRGPVPSLARRTEAINDLASSEKAFDAPGPATEIVRMLVAKGVDFDRSRTKGQIPLNYVARNQNPGLVRLLLSLGADPNVRKPSGSAVTPLWSSIVIGGESTLLRLNATASERVGLHRPTMKADPAYLNRLRRSVGVLLDGGADPMGEVHSTSWSATTPFHRACYWGEAGMVRHMLRKGAKPNARQGANGNTPGKGTVTFDWTPLHVCALRNGPSNVKTIKVLIAAGADPAAKDSRGMTALDLARQKGHAAVAQALAALREAVISEPAGAMFWARN